MKAERERKRGYILDLCKKNLKKGGGGGGGG